MKRTPLCTYTHLGFLINWIMAERPDLDLTFAEIYQAARQKQLIELLRHRFGHVADLSLLRHDSLTNIEHMELALSDAASALEGREAGKACVQRSGLCLAQAIVLEAIQQQLHRFSQPARSRQSRQWCFSTLTLQSPSTRFKAFQSLSRIFFDNTPNLKNGVSEATISTPVAQTGSLPMALR